MMRRSERSYETLVERLGAWRVTPLAHSTESYSRSFQSQLFDPVALRVGPLRKVIVVRFRQLRCVLCRGRKRLPERPFPIDPQRQSFQSLQPAQWPIA